MKPLFCFQLCIFSILNILSAQPAIQWQKTLGGTDLDIASSIKQTNDGGYIVAGWSRSNNGDVTGHHGTNNNPDYWIVKIDSTGAIQWQRSLGGTQDDYANSILQTPDEGFIVAGYSESNDGDVNGNHGSVDYWIVKLDSNGAIQWQKSLGGTFRDYAYSIKQATDGGYIVAGNSQSNDGDVIGNHGSEDCWIVKLDSIGSIQWQKSLGGTFRDYAYSILQTSDGGFIVAGYSDSNDGDVTGNHGSVDYWIVKLDSLSSIQWQKSLGGSSQDEANSIYQTTDGGYIVAGWSRSNDGDVSGHHGTSLNTDYWIVKVDNTGGIQWQKSLGGTQDEWPKSIQQVTEGGYIIAGVSGSNDGDVTGHHGTNNYLDYWIVKLDSLGALKWQRSLGGTKYDYPGSIQQTIDGRYIIAGGSGSVDGDVTANHGSDDFWVVKLNSLISIDEIQNSIFDFRITPNPFIDKSFISFQLSSSVNTNIEIHDIEGRLIKNLNSKNLSIGTNELVWDATNNTGCKVENGIYFITIISDNFSETKKVVFLKN